MRVSYCTQLWLSFCLVVAVVTAPVTALPMGLDHGRLVPSPGMKLHKERHADGSETITEVPAGGTAKGKTGTGHGAIISATLIPSKDDNGAKNKQHRPSSSKHKKSVPVKNEPSTDPDSKN